LLPPLVLLLRHGHFSFDSRSGDLVTAGYDLTDH